MPDSPPDVTVIVRSRNDEFLIDRTLQALSGQTVQHVEILCADDHSTDRTREIIRFCPNAILLENCPSPYVPGRVLNYAVSKASASIVVFNNSDAIPLEHDYLEKLIAPLTDGNVAASFGNQVCRPDAKALVRKDYERAFGDGKESAKWKHFFSLASSAARKDFLQAHPFDETYQYSEDIAWSWERRKEGFRMEYVPAAMVEHSHNYPYRAMWKRFYNEGYADFRIYGEPVLFSSACRQFCMESLRDCAWLAKHREFASFLSILPYRFIQKFAHWRGACRAERGGMS